MCAELINCIDLECVQLSPYHTSLVRENDMSAYTTYCFWGTGVFDTVVLLCF